MPAKVLQALSSAMLAHDSTNQLLCRVATRPAQLVRSADNMHAAQEGSLCMAIAGPASMHQWSLMTAPTGLMQGKYMTCQPDQVMMCIQHRWASVQFGHKTCQLHHLMTCMQHQRASVHEEYRPCQLEQLLCFVCDSKSQGVGLHLPYICYTGLDLS